MYPLRFQPLFKQYIWGGRRLETVLGKPLGEGENYAESWEIVDHGSDQSVVANGEFAGLTLHQLVRDHGGELFGRHFPQECFPLLFKFLDANRDLSVQVHPNDQQAAALQPPDLGKTEAWVILHADPGSKAYAGLKRGITPEHLAEAMAAGETEACLHAFQPKPGDCILVRAGTVHALGAGLLVAEIQQASNTTFRLFDWNRTDADGKPRQLHVEQGLAVIDFEAREIGAVVPRQLTGQTERLAECDKFILDRHTIETTLTVSDNRFHIVAVLSGSAILDGISSESPLAAGQSMLVPASCEQLSLVPEQPTVLLDMYLP